MHTEDLGYLKMGIFSPFWMINKTGLTLEYKVQLLGFFFLLRLTYYTTLNSIIILTLGGLYSYQTPFNQESSAALNNQSQMQGKQVE